MASRRDRAPTAAELRARAAVADVTAAAGHFAVEGGFHVGFGGVVRPSLTVALPGPVTFRHEPGRWWIEDPGGLVRGVDGDRAVVRHPEQGLVSLPAERLRIGIGPERFLRPGPLPTGDAAPVETDWQGRRAWRSGPLVWDDETGILLREEQGSSWAELTDLDLDPPPGTYDLPDAPAWVPPDDLRRPVEDGSAWGDRPRPTVTWTPMGLPHSPHDGEVATGWLVQDVRCLTPQGAAFLRLHRRPDGVEAALPETAHHWYADGCDWALEPSAVDEGVPPFTADELATMADSVDTATPWPSA